MKKLFLLPVIALSFALSADANPSAKVDKTTGEQKKNHDMAAGSQKKVSKIANETRTIVDDYRTVLRKIENTKVYNNQLRQFITSQNEEMVSIRKKIASLKTTNKEILPLMVRMVDTLEKFVSLDTPFLPEERSNRIAQLKLMMKRADVSTSEKYRRILEAYQIENEYGRTIEAYRGVQKMGEKELTVDFLRVGRVALMFQSLDGEQNGLWSHKENKWVELPSEYRRAVTKGLRIAKKQLAPDLVKMPIKAPVEAKVEKVSTDKKEVL